MIRNILAVSVVCLFTLSATDAAEKKVISIQTNTQATVGDLRIGAGNFWDDEYTDARKVRRKGPTAGLWISVREGANKSKEVRLRVHPGQEVEVEIYKLHIIEIGDDRIKIEITSP